MDLHDGRSQGQVADSAMLFLTPLRGAASQHRWDLSLTWAILLTPDRTNPARTRATSPPSAVTPSPRPFAATFTGRSC
jgi:hypothetical protein